MYFTQQWVQEHQQTVTHYRSIVEQRLHKL